MSMSSHLEELRRKHEVLSEKVKEIQRSPGSTDAEITELKKQKLQIKEEIERLATA